MDNTISHGRAAEILGIPKYDLIEIYDKMGLAYLSFDIEEIDNQINLIKRKVLQTSTNAKFARTLYALQVANSAVREYAPDGRGGLFTIRNCEEDLRKVEIWYQLCWYLDTII